MTTEETITQIEQGKNALGIEFGSTRIKAILIDGNHSVLASGSFVWENQLVDGIWTYDLETVKLGLQGCYRDLCEDIKKRYGIPLRRIGAIGISAMMHGYLPFDIDGKLLSPFRTWRNTNAEEAGFRLTELMQFNIPIRWSIAHLYQSILEEQPHVQQIRFLTTLSGYIHWKLTGKKVLGIGDASGMFPIDPQTKNYVAAMLDLFDTAISQHGYPWNIREILPEVLCAGDNAGTLTAEGGLFIDPTGNLQPGIPLSAPEGDAGTGMVATNSIAPRTGNVSAGTSIFAMAVLEKPLERTYAEIDMVTTPNGWPVAMVHCNNCTSDFDAWARVFQEFSLLCGKEMRLGEILDLLYQKSLDGTPACGGIVVYNFLSGEPLVGLSEGRPMILRRPESSFTLANLMRAQLYSTIASLRIGMEILYRESVKIERFMGHGGLFITPNVGQTYMSDALGIPVSVMKTAGEGGAYGVAVLAAYSVNRLPGESLECYLDQRVFQNSLSNDVHPDPVGANGFQVFLEAYINGLDVERVAVASL